jgi:hypothetical protein
MKQAAASGLGLLLLFPSFLLLLSSGCDDGDRSDCAIAKDNIAQCNAQMEAKFGALEFRGLPLTISDDDCSAWNACDAKCVNGASCEGMWKALRGGTGSDPNQAPNDSGAFTRCLMECSARFDQP